MDITLNKYLGSENLNTIPIKKIGIILLGLVFISGLSGCVSFNCFLSEVKSKIFKCEVPDDDRDHISNACDDDWDNDGIVNASDSCDTVFNSGNDSDGDGIDDVCDNCRYNANGRQKDSDNDLLGDACDNPDPNYGVNNVIALPDTPLNPGAPFWVTAKIQNNTGKVIQTLRPDCYNTYLILPDAQRLCRKGPAYGIPKDIVKIPAGGSFFVKCDLNDQFESFPPSGTYALKAIYENLIQDPEFDPSAPKACSKTEDPECYPLWIGAIASNPKNVTIGPKTFKRTTAEVSFIPSDWSAFYWRPSEEKFITVHITNIRDESNTAPLPDMPLTLIKLSVDDVDLASIKINGSAPCDSFIRKNEIISTCPAIAVISSLGTVIPGNTIYPKIQGALKNPTNNEIFGYFSGSAKVTISSSADSVSADIEPGAYPNGINLKSTQLVAVGTFGNPDFNARAIDPGTVTLASDGVKAKNGGYRLMRSFKDLNRDALLDLVLHFDTKDLNLIKTDEIAVLEGRTFKGIQFMGSDTLKIME